jgi:hypothetical protein
MEKTQRGISENANGVQLRQSSLAGILRRIKKAVHTTLREA